MMIKRWASYFALAVCALFVSFPASAVERSVTYLAQAFNEIASELHGASMTRLELGLASWRKGSESTSESLKSNLRADSNHFVMVSTSPAGVPDWDAGAKAC